MDNLFTGNKERYGVLIKDISKLSEQKYRFIQLFNFILMYVGRTTKVAVRVTFFMLCISYQTILTWGGSVVS